MTERPNALLPSPIHITDDVLADLRSRIAATRWPDDAGNRDGFYGVDRVRLQALADYWCTEYDWRAAESAMNAYQHHRVEVDGVPVHFLRKPGVGPDPTPLILTHGWPWTFWHWSKVIDPLADPGAHGGDPAEAFDVIVPSFPGFGFSSPDSAPWGGGLRIGVSHACDQRVVMDVRRFGVARRPAGRPGVWRR